MVTLAPIGRAVVLVLALLVAVDPLHAAAPSNEAEDRCRAHHDRAIALVDEGRERDALEAFRAAIEAAPDSVCAARSLRAAGYSAEAIGDEVAAVDSFIAFVDWATTHRDATDLAATAPQMLLNAAALTRILDRRQDTLALLDRYVRDFPDAIERDRVALDAAAEVEVLGGPRAWVEARRRYEAIARRSRDPMVALEAWSRAAVAAVRAGAATGEVTALIAKTTPLARDLELEPRTVAALHGLVAAQLAFADRTLEAYLTKPRAAQFEAARKALEALSSSPLADARHLATCRLADLWWRRSAHDPHALAEARRIAGEVVYATRFAPTPIANFMTGEREPRPPFFRTTACLARLLPLIEPDAYPLATDARLTEPSMLSPGGFHTRVTRAGRTLDFLR